MQRQRLLEAVEILATIPSGSDGINQLVAGGFSRSEAIQLSELVPEAFAVPVMETLGVAKIVDEVSALNRRGEWEQIPLRDLPVFQEALSLAREHRATLIMDQGAYKAIAERSSLVSTASNALNSGANISGATMAVALIRTTAEELRGECVSKN